MGLGSNKSQPMIQGPKVSIFYQSTWKDSFFTYPNLFLSETKNTQDSRVHSKQNNHWLLLLLSSDSVYVSENNRPPWEKEEKETGSVAAARTGTTHLDRFATDANSLVCWWTPKPLLTPSGCLVSAIGFALVPSRQHFLLGFSFLEYGLVSDSAFVASIS